MPSLYILIGLPGSGKSTWCSKNASRDAVIISSDNMVDDYARERGMNYSEAWGEINHGWIKRTLHETFDRSVSEGRDIIVDMTNMGAKARRSWLAKTPGNYEKIAVDFQIDDKELDRRLDERAKATGKIIGKAIINSMASRYEAPTREEGFTKILRIRK